MKDHLDNLNIIGLKKTRKNMLQDLFCIDHLKWVPLLTMRCHNALAYCLKGECVEEKLDFFPPGNWATQLLQQLKMQEIAAGTILT